MKKRNKVVLSLTLIGVLLAGGLAGSSQTSSQEQATETTAGQTTAETTTNSGGEVEASDTEEAENKHYVIGVAQCHMNTPYRVALTTELEAAVKERGYDWEFIFTDGQNDPTTQINNVYDLISADVDCILMAPAQSDPLTPVAGEVLAAGIPLVLVDRTISNDDFTAFVGGDNVNAGRVVGEWIIENYGDQEEVIVVEMRGTLGSSADNDRHAGFREALEGHDNIKIVSDQSADYKRDEALTLMENILQANDHIDVLYCGSDNMALGAIQAIEAAGRTGEMAVFGTDGQKDMCDTIISGQTTGTVFYPTGAEEAVDLIAKILNGESYERINMLDTPLLLSDDMDEWYDRCF